MTKMQSLEEEALLKGALSLQASMKLAAKNRLSVSAVGEGGDVAGNGSRPETAGHDSDGYFDQVW